MKKRMLKTGVKRKTAFILSLISMALLLIFGVLCFVGKGQFLSAITEEVSKLPAEALKGLTVAEISQLILNIIMVIAVIWLVIAVLTGWAIFLLERNRGKWYVLLILGILALLSGIITLGTMIILSGIMIIVASVLYKNEKKV